MYRLSVDDPYTNNLRKKLMPYERKYSVSEDSFDDQYNYVPSSMLTGGSRTGKPIPRDAQIVVEKLINRYDLEGELVGSGFTDSINIGKFKEKMKELIFDNEYIKVALKIGAMAAVTTLLATLGAPAVVVALTPLFLSWTEIAIRNYKKEKEGGSIKEWSELGERAAVHSINAAREYQQTGKKPKKSLESLNNDWNEFSNRKLNGKGKGKGKKELDLRYSVGDLPVQHKRPYLIQDNNEIGSYLGGARQKKQQSSLQQRRAQKVREIMRSKQMSLAEASRYIKQNGIKY